MCYNVQILSLINTFVHLLAIFELTDVAMVINSVPINLDFTFALI